MPIFTNMEVIGRGMVKAKGRQKRYGGAHDWGRW